MVYSDTIYFRRCHSVTANFQSKRTEVSSAFTSVAVAVSQRIFKAEQQRIASSAFTSVAVTVSQRIFKAT